MEKTMDIRRITLVSFTLVLLALLAACATATQAPSPTPSAVLVDTDWVLVSLNANPLIEDTQITLNFADVSLKGSAGCNTYWGSYTASEDSLRLSDVYWTEIGCTEPEGVLDQEQAYLKALNAAARFRVDGDRLEVYDEAGTQILTFVAVTSDAVVATPAPSQPSAAAPTSTPVAVVATAPPAAEPPGGFKPYLDSVAGVAIHIPESWVVTGIVPGQWAVLQSYPQDKYVGGEALQQGDTKCDLNIRPHGTSAADLIQQWKSSPDTTIVSEGEIVLQSGNLGIWIELENMGRSLSLISDVNGRAVALTCWGEFEPFDAIAVTLGAADIVEDMPSTPIEPAAGFKQYHDSVAGVSVNIPESWVVTGVDPGAYAILLSYPEDKYVGGEGRAPGDTKCDLNIRPPGTSAADLIQQWKSNPDTTIIAEGPVLLQSGQLGTRIELENMGRSLSLISDVNGRAVALTCWGDFEPFHAISVTLSAAPAPDQPGPGSYPYRDQETGVSVLVPENWVVNEIVPGHTATLESADTECQLLIQPAETSMAQIVQDWRNNTAITILSDVELTLASAETGIKIEYESMVGRSLLLITEVNERAVVLACDGDFAPFDEIAITLGSGE